MKDQINVINKNREDSIKLGNGFKAEDSIKTEADKLLDSVG